jgi:hypothetical protein
MARPNSIVTSRLALVMAAVTAGCLPSAEFSLDFLGGRKGCDDADDARTG